MQLRRVLPLSTEQGREQWGLRKKVCMCVCVCEVYSVCISYTHTDILVKLQVNIKKSTADLCHHIDI